MSKLYYTDALASAYMAREFKVRISILNPFYEEDNGQDPFKWSSNWLLIMEAGQDGFEKGEGEVHLDDYHIFEASEGDLCKFAHPSFVWEFKIIDEGEDEMLKAEYKDCYKIIQRNNKSFLNPEKED